MKNSFPKIIYALTLTNGVFMSGGALAGGNPTDSVGTLANNPYAPIVNRNAFALNPLPDPQVPSANVDNASSLPKITVQGFMNLLGKPDVLFKISMPPAGPGQPAMELTCTMYEGDELGEIRLVRIDQTAGTVIFNNHGIVQEIQLMGR